MPIETNLLRLTAVLSDRGTSAHCWQGSLKQAPGSAAPAKPSVPLIFRPPRLLVPKDGDPRQAALARSAEQRQLPRGFFAGGAWGAGWRGGAAEGGCRQPGQRLIESMAAAGVLEQGAHLLGEDALAAHPA